VVNEEEEFKFENSRSEYSNRESTTQRESLAGKEFISEEESKVRF